MLVRALLVGFVAALLCFSARAQCEPRWFTGGWNLGFDGPVYASTVWDPDGPGPEPERLVVAGAFTIAGDRPAPAVASWDGSAWHALGDGLTGDVYLLAVVNGELIIGGEFETTGHGQNLARLEGNTWLAVDPAFSDGVSALAAHDGDLIVAGASRVRRWTGAGWQQLGPSLGYVPALASFNGDLIAGGVGSQGPLAVARWDGTGWRGMDSAGGSDAYPYVFCACGGSLFAGCSADTYNGPELVWRWDGQLWQPIGGGLATGYRGAITVLGAYGDHLIAGGATKLAGSIGLSQWDGSQWSPWPAYGNSLPGRYVNTMTTFRGDLFAGGNFTRAGPCVANYLARWDGQAWHAMSDVPTVSSGAEVHAIAPFGGGIAVGGTFQLDAEEGPTRNVASWDGTAWHAIGGGIGGPGVTDTVYALAEHGGELFVGGRINAFNTGVVKWDGASWWMAGAQTGTVNALGHHNGDLIAAGQYIADLGNGVWSHIGRWDGQAWQGLPNGPDIGIACFTTFDGELVVGGGFVSAGGQPANHIAAWNGTNWHPLGGGLSFGVTALAEYSGRLLAAGYPGPSSTSLAAWDGSSWQYLPGTANTGPQYVYALAVSGSDLYVGGGFTTLGGFPTNAIARWDGTNWNTLCAGLTQPVPQPQYGANVFALAVQDQSVIAGGTFTAAGGRYAPFVARRGPPTPSCYANCDCSETPPFLSPSDFICFLARFASADPYANCDGSTTPPTLNVQDFICFLNRFAAGCQ